jgi:3-phenylpropionate/trans-cinnamate dioxygenase ferredoxin subunit
MTTETTISVCKLDDLPPGAMRLIEVGQVKIGVFNCGGELHAIEDRCSHDDGPLAEGEFDAGSCTVECPRHGSLFDLQTGKPKTLPAYRPVETYEVRVDADEIKLEL